VKQGSRVDTIHRVVGEWELTCNLSGSHPISRKISLRSLDSRQIEGRSEGVGMRIAGQLDADRITLSLTVKDDEPWELTGTVSDREMTGEGTYSGAVISWYAKRPAIPPSEPTLHIFQTSRYSERISPWEKAALHIFPGDTVRTEAPDSRGYDKFGIRRSLGFPVIGPFFVEGAMPGQTLVVRIQSLRFNRTWGMGKDSIAAGALLPASHKLDSTVEGQGVVWNLDLVNNVARPANPPERLRDYCVHLKASLGCIAVPNKINESLHPRRTGPNGGNLDSTLIGEGCIIFLPVAHRGALLFLGGGHAIHSEGGVTGEIVETSLDIEFTVGIRHKRLRGVRAEDVEKLIAFGTGPGLAEAFQQATSELGLWLSEEYEMTSSEIGLLFAASLRYSVAKFYGHNTTVVAMIPKASLAVV
jgi:amidase